MLPKAGVFAHKHAETVAQEIAARIKGSEAPKPYDGLGYCFIEIGDGTAGFAKGNFYAEPDPTIKASKPGKGASLSIYEYLTSRQIIPSAFPADQDHADQR